MFFLPFFYISLFWDLENNVLLFFLLLFSDLVCLCLFSFLLSLFCLFPFLFCVFLICSCLFFLFFSVYFSDIYLVHTAILYYSSFCSLFCSLPLCLFLFSFPITPFCLLLPYVLLLFGLFFFCYSSSF